VATYAIGDIQGCYQSLQALLEKLELEAEDRLWLCGDLVNRGPASAEVLRWAMGQGDSLVAVLGNHDLHLLAAAAGARAFKKRDSFQDVLEADDRETLLSWLRSRPFAHREGGHFLVHAGLHPAWSVDQASELASECMQAMQSGSWLDAWTASRPSPPLWSANLVGQERLACAMSVLVGVRTLYADGRLETNYAGPPGQKPAGTTPWFEGRADEETIVFGHWAALGLRVEEKLLGLDTGCVWGHALTAIRLEDRKVFTQPALEKLAG
jgi:bis(5'-nucleosyl)-tetraphosphatase (symmetrical)